MSQCHLGTVERIAVEHIDHIGRTSGTIDARGAIRIGENHRRNNCDRNFCGLAVGRVELFADGIVEAIGASRGASGDIDAASSSIKRQTSRDRRTAGN